ncbi:MAG: Xaa-Pro aminopeptidase [bacterium]
MNLDFACFKERRKKLVETLKHQCGHTQKGIILVKAGFEQSRYAFRQESSFYYLTGIVEPAVILKIDFDGTDVLYVPNFGSEREKWVTVSISPVSKASSFGLDGIKYLSDPVKGYSYPSLFRKEMYEHFLNDLAAQVDDQALLFLCLDNMSVEQTKFSEFLEQNIPLITTAKKDVSPFIHAQRRSKESSELDSIRQAIAITHQAHQRAAQEISCGKKEYEIQAEVEYIFTKNNVQPAFPSIIATGKNSTILHYTQRNNEIKDGDLVVVDVGAEFQCYAADITRTYPANGKFSKRQCEVYDIVLETQRYVQEMAKPGMFLKHEDFQEKSLHHIAVTFLKKHGYACYFSHGIGHFLGLDVHDVGDCNVPLAPGDVFTIEPGIYIPEEKLGIRIEDDYLMTHHGVECLSCNVPKTVVQIEHSMKK